MHSEQVAELVRRAIGSDGVVTAADLDKRGLGRRSVDRLIESGTLERVGVGLLRVRAHPPTWRQRERVAVLAAPQPAGASHRAAATIWGADDIGATPVEITAPRRSRWHAQWVLVHRGRLSELDITMRDGIAVTTPARTIIDLAAVVDLCIVERVLDQFLRRGLVTEDHVIEMLGRGEHRRRAGSGGLRALLERRHRVNGVPETTFETRFLQILRRQGLPEPERQYVLLDDDGTFVARFDAAYPAYRVGMEADSERWHLNRQRFIDDRTRRNRAEALGWRVPSFTWHHVTKEARTVGTTVEQTLRAAGWPGS